MTIFRREKSDLFSRTTIWFRFSNVYENIALPVELDGGKVDKNFLEEVVGVFRTEREVKQYAE